MNQCDVECEVCPYDNAHMILKSRMLNHLAKCSKNYPDSEKQPCIFNKKHVVPIVEMKYHVASCPDRIKVDMYKMKVGGVECPIKEEVPIIIDMPASEENWDEEPPVTKSVLNKIKDDIAEKNVILTTSAIGQSRRKRKEFRDAEIRRHIALQQENYTAPLRRPAAVAVDKKVQHIQPVRPPSEVSSTSSLIQSRLRKQEDLKKSAAANSATSMAVGGDVNRKVKVLAESSDDELKSVEKIADDMKQKVKLSNRSDPADSFTSRIAEPSNLRSYASLLAEQQLASKNQKLNCNSQSQWGVKTRSDNSDGMQLLTSSIFNKGPRGRGRSTVASSPSSIISQTSRSTTVTPTLSTDINLLTDENGFLYMPVPGKGRGKP